MRIVGPLILGCLVVSAAARAQTAEPPRKLWAVLVGVEKYRKDLPACPDSTNNVRDVEAWLVNSQSSDWRDIGLLRLNEIANTAASDTLLTPTYDNFRKIRPWLAGKKPGKNDVILFYFSGYSFAEPADADRKGSGQSVHLLPSDFNTNAPGANSLSLDEVFDAPELRECQVVIWLETSFQGHGPSGWRAPSPKDFRPDSKRFLDGLVGQTGRTAWIAADGVPSGFVGEKRRPRGRFTASLLAALGPPGQRAPDESSGLMATLAALEKDNELARQGFLPRGKILPGLGLRREELARPLTPPPPEMIVQRGHSDEVTALALTPDGSTLISASRDSTVKFWNPDDLSLVKTQTGHLIGVGAMALSHDGNTVSSGDGQGLVQVRPLAKPRPESSPRSQNRAKIVQILAVPASSPPRFVGRDLQGRALTWLAAKPDLTAIVGTERAGITTLDLAVSGEPGASGAAIAALGSDGKVRTFDAGGRPLATLEGPRLRDGVPLEQAFLALSHDGAQAVAATDDGRVVLIPTGEKLGDAQLLDLPDLKAIRGMAMSRSGLLAIRSDEPPALLLLSIADRRVVARLPGEYLSPCWSADGGVLAAATIADGSGMVNAWRVDRAGLAEAITLPFPDRRPREALMDGGAPSALLVAGGRLVVGTGSGRVLGWTLPGPGAPPSASWGFSVEPGRGQVLHLSAHPRRPVVLAIDRQQKAWTWNLLGNGPSAVPGSWTSGTLLPDGSMALTAAMGPDENPKGVGEIHLHDARGVATGRKFTGPGTRPPAWGLIAADASGRWIAASTSDGQGGVGSQSVRAAVWKVSGGEPWHTFLDDQGIGQVVALAFSRDGSRLLLVHRGDDQSPGRVTIHDLKKAGAPALHERPFALPRAADPGALVPLASTAAIDPSDPDRFVVGSADGLVFEGNLKAPNRLAPLTSLRALRAVTGLEYSPDGNRLMVSFEDTRLILLSREEGRFQIEPNLLWGHDERVNAVGSIRSAGHHVFVTAGDDGVLKLWKPSEKAGPVGSLAAWDASATALRWLAFTPAGAFDGTIEGTKFLRRVGRRVDTLESAIKHAQRVGLARQMAQGQAVTLDDQPWPDDVPPPRLTIEGSETGGRQVEVRLKFDPEADPVSLRLYHNGQPIPLLDTDGREILAPNPSGTSVRVALLPNDNTLYAMISRPGAVDGRSNEITVLSTAPPRPGRLHVLSLGVANYSRRALKFATDDAVAIAQRLKDADRLALGEDNLGIVRVLTDGEVNMKAIHRFFLDLASRTRDNPEDRVVVFLAGHTAVAEGKDGAFCLLRSDYPFATDWPAGNLVAIRDAEEDRLPADKARAHAIAFADIYNELSRITPLNRLVIVDGCSAQSILRDAAVRRIQDNFARAQLSTRVAYVLGSRSGSPSFEDERLAHGLLTYSLLRGTGGPNLGGKRAEVEKVFLPFATGADLDADGTTTTDELQNFADRTVPPLVTLAVKDMPRGAPGDDPEDLGPRPVMASRSSTSFPLLARPPR